VQNPIDDLGDRRALERKPAREHLVQDHAERKEVCAMVDRPAERLFGRHV
jgi:hypothetical protein